MASTVNKRQQARNEKALQDITRSVPGNDRCADCNTPNPSWASWNLGIFLCIRCAALHRKLGTHISKVKSLSMDSWSVEQVENMKKVGNVNSNRHLNPRSISAKIPVDVDEVDAAIEKHIRLKYEQRAFSSDARSLSSTRQNTGSTATGSDEPPPLPPKPDKHWGFGTRSASSTLPRTKKHDFADAPISSAITVEQSRGKRGFFGMRVTSISNNFDQKLNMLKEMGFTDAKQNQDILKNANGNLDRAVEVLSRLNELGPPEPSPVRAVSPVLRTTNSGLRLTKTRSDQTGDVWEVRENKRSATAPLPPLPTRSQSTEPVTNDWNPFLQPQRTQPLAGAMQAMSISPAPQSQHSQGQSMANPWGFYLQPQHAMSVPAIPQQQQHQASPISGTNPFYQTASPQSFSSSNPWSQQMTPQTMTPSTPHSNPFGLPGVESNQIPILQQSTYSQLGQYTPTQMPASYSQPATATVQGHISQNPFQQVASPSAQQPNPFALLPTPPYAAVSDQPQAGTSYAQQQQQQQVPGQQSVYAQATPGFAPSAQHTATLPFAHPGSQHIVNNQQSIGGAQTYQYSGAPQQNVLTTTNSPIGRHDKSSILALYSAPSNTTQRQLQTLPEDSISAPMPPQPTQSGNPFAVPQQVSITAHTSRESRDFQAFQQDGRHSPDAFAGLSSRFMR